MSNLQSYLFKKDNITKQECLNKKHLYRTYTIKEKLGKKEFLYFIEGEDFKTVVKENKSHGITKALYVIALHEMLNNRTKQLKKMNRNELYLLLRKYGIQAISNIRKERKA